MFCSKCGKTIRTADMVCPHCQAPIGDNRFGGIPYTSAQFTIAPGQKTFEALNNYTRTTYTSMGDAAQQGSEADSRTTYRPVYEGASAPESVRRDMRAAVAGIYGEESAPTEDAPGFIPGVPLSQAAKDTLSELDEELKPDEAIDRSQFKSRPIQSSGRAGISRDVSEYIRKLEDNQNRRGASRRRSEAVYDDYAAEADNGFAPVSDDYEDNPDGFDDMDEDQYEDMGASRFSARSIIKIVIALAVVAALVFGIITWVGYIRDHRSSAPIEGVSETLYEQGVALIKSHVDSAYVSEMISKYTTDGILSMSSSLEEANNAINALMPAEPAANDQTFLQALQAIQNNIVNAITMDALAVNSASETATVDSENRWAIVNNSIAQLEAATSAAELTAIINGQTITVQSATPEPTVAPAATYAPLQKGDESNDVLRLQNRLYELGYLNDDRDGVFGSKTQTAVKMFQETAGISASGIADNATQQALYADDAPYAAGAVTPTPAPTATPAPEPTEAAIQPAEAGLNAA